jgi:hypothetical protein
VPPLFEDAEIATFAVGLLAGAALLVADLGQILQASQVKPWGGVQLEPIDRNSRRLLRCFLNPLAGAVAIEFPIQVR